MEVRVLNGGYNTVEPMQGFNSVTPMNGFNSVTPMNGFNSVVPLNGTRRTVALNGNGNTVWYVAPISLMDIGDVPEDWIPTGLTDEQIEYLKTAYIMGDQNALNGKLGDALKKIGTGVLKVAEKVVPTVLKVVPGGAALAPVAGKALGAVNAKIASDQAIKQAAAAGLSQQQQADAGALAAQSMVALQNVGIDASPQVVADRATMAADAGVTPKSTGLAGWWGQRTTTQKWLIGGGTFLLIGGTVYYFYNKNKKGKRK